MSKKALIFSGQGSQYVGMGLELTAVFPETGKIFEEGSDILGFDLKKIIENGTENELSDTLVSQPAIFTVSLIAYECFKSLGVDFSAAAGHSLGEYAALAALGAISREDGFKAIKTRSRAMKRAAVQNPGVMAAVMSADVNSIEKICGEITENGDYISAVNYNSRQQTVIAGSAEGLEKASEALTAVGVKRIIKLNVSAAFHSKFMREAGEEFGEGIKDIKFNKPGKDFYSNLTGDIINDFSSENMRDILSKHIYSPVHFTDELANMRKNGIDTFIELGPGKVLSGLIKKTLDGVTAVNIEDKKSFDAAGDELRG